MVLSILGVRQRFSAFRTWEGRAWLETRLDLGARSSSRVRPLSVASDIYSLGVLLFFLVTGTYPIQGKSLADVRAAHVGGTRALLADVRPDLHRSFVRVVERALSPNRAERYTSAGALLRDLNESESSEPVSSSRAENQPSTAAPARTETMWTTGRRTRYALSFLAGGRRDGRLVVDTARQRHRPESFDRHGSDAVDRRPAVCERARRARIPMVGEGIAEGLIHALEQVSSVHVLSSASLRPYASAGNVREWHRLGVRAVVTGHFTAVPDGVVVAPELVDATDGTPLWTGDQSRVALGDLPGLANEIALRVASKLAVTVSPSDEQRLPTAMHFQSAALSHYLQGRRAAEGFTPLALRQAIALFRQAKEDDPQFAEADKGIAYCYLTYLGWMFSPHEAMPSARIAAENALKATNGDDSEAMAYLGVIAYAYDWNWVEADSTSSKRSRPRIPGRPSISRTRRI